MRVLHVVNDADMGGAQTLIEQLVIAHRPDESHVLVLMGRGALSARLEDVAATVSYLGVDKESVDLLTLMRSARRTIRVLNPDVVHSHLLQSDLVAAVAGFGLGVPVVSTVHTSGMTPADPMKSRVLGRIMGIVSSIRFSSVVACGTGAHEYMRRRAYPMRRSQIILNGVNVPAPQPTPAPRDAPFLSLARWHPMKDHESLFSALAIVRSSGHPRATLVCAGSGITEDNSELVRLAEAAGVRDAVTFLGPVDDPRALIRSAQALVFSSSYGEALPMAGLEALSESVPVIATRLGDCPKLLVRSEFGADPGSPASLAKAMLAFLKRTGDERRLDRVAAYQTVVEHYDVSARAAEYRALYAEFVPSLAEAVA